MKTVKLELTLQQAEQLAWMLKDARSNNVTVGELCKDSIGVKWDKSKLSELAGDPRVDAYKERLELYRTSKIVIISIEDN